MEHERPAEQDPWGGDQQPQGVPWKLIALLVVVVGLAIFFLQNGQDGQVEFLWFDGSWPQWAVIGVSVLAGVVLDRLAGWQWRRSRNRRSQSS